MPPCCVTRSSNCGGRNKPNRETTYEKVPFLYLRDPQRRVLGLYRFFQPYAHRGGRIAGNRVFIRNFGTLVILTIVFALFHRQVFRIKLKHLPIFLCSGLLSILTLSLVYFQCQTMCSLSVAAVLLYLAPSFVVISAPCCGRHR